MTFDTSTDEGTGLTGATTPNNVTGTTGLWSYFLNWKSTPSCAANSNCAKGRPAGCSTAAVPLEVGARNAAAPPWEGRMVPFGSTFAPISDHPHQQRPHPAALDGGPSLRRDPHQRASERRPHLLPQRRGQRLHHRGSDLRRHHRRGLFRAAVRRARLAGVPQELHHPLDGRRAEPRPSPLLRGHQRWLRRRMPLRGQVVRNRERPQKPGRGRSPSPPTSSVSRSHRSTPASRRPSTAARSPPREPAEARTPSTPTASATRPRWTRTCRPAARSPRLPSTAGRRTRFLPPTVPSFARRCRPSCAPSRRPRPPARCRYSPPPRARGHRTPSFLVPIRSRRDLAGSSRAPAHQVRGRQRGRLDGHGSDRSADRRDQG